LGHDALNALKIHSKFIPCRKNIISIALAISYTCLYVGKEIKKFQQQHEAKLHILTTMDCFTLVSQKTTLQIVTKKKAIVEVLIT